MKQIRRNTFESNSSSTHSLVMCSESDYERWQRGEVYLADSYLIECRNELCTFDEIIAKAKCCRSRYLESEYGYRRCTEIMNMTIDELKDACIVYGYEDYFDDYLERFEDTYATKNGEKIIAFGQYGYN